MGCQFRCRLRHLTEVKNCEGAIEPKSVYARLIRSTILSILTYIGAENGDRSRVVIVTNPWPVLLSPDGTEDPPCKRTDDPYICQGLKFSR
ncbi:hypothetical protein TNCV_2141271 [Trichonephila clavipes]|uniref:Uncharacterized protein n=1 Tax=Trichonephila clavipes TaxID=2585209 RepID=A0A8X6RXI1_TRICX|nr:hypothetical protein TNCV_2141271 [Trichonephila clavipes]